MRVEVTDGAEAAARRGAELIAEAARAAVAERGCFAVALSGGRTPRLLYAALGDQEVPWDAADVFQVDERIAPGGDPDRNLTHLEELLPAAAIESLRPMPADDDDPKRAAERYDAALPDALDLVHLGLGTDGHIASLMPGDPVLDVTDRRVALTAGQYRGRRRMTLTYRCLAAARCVLWLVTGEGKRDALVRLLAGDESIPASRVKVRDGVVIADRAAAGAGH